MLPALWMAQTAEPVTGAKPAYVPLTEPERLRLYLKRLVFGSSSLLHEDNRHFRSGETGFSKRLRYALKSSVMARHDDGTENLSISGIGSFVREFLPDLFHRKRGPD